MTRPHRQDFAGARMHVYSRGANGLGLFPHREVRSHFFDWLSRAEEDFGVRVHAYAMMGSHFHLVVTSLDGGVSAFMEQAWGAVARHANRVHGREGAVCRSRFGSKIVDSTSYWRHVVAYVHLNDASLSRDALRTSHGAYLAAEAGVVRREEHLELFGGVDGYRAYLAQWGRRPPARPELAVAAWVEGVMGLARYLACAQVGERAAPALLATWVGTLGLANRPSAELMGVSVATYKRLRRNSVADAELAALDASISGARGGDLVL